MKKILILTAKFGDGHHTAAVNIREAVHLLAADAKVEVVDLLQASYGSLYTLARNTHLKVVQYAPRLWSSIYSFIDHSTVLDRNLTGFGKLVSELGRLVEETQPDCVVSTYPLYGHVVNQLYRDHHEKPFRFVTVITDSISVNSAWFKPHSDTYCVANESTAQVLRQAGVPEARIRALGFPVSPVFALEEAPPLPYPELKEPKRILYIINSGQKKAGKAVDRLLEIPDVRLTVTVGRDAWLKAKLMDRTREFKARVQILGWTNQMPALMRSHHLMIGKAGGATVQESIAARCPMIINQIIPGQEAGNAQLIKEAGIGAVAEGARDVAALVEHAFARNARRWSEWRDNLSSLSNPDAALRIAELLLADENGSATGLSAKLFSSKAAGFDCICITDHLADPNRLIGKMTRLCNFTLGADQLDEYFEVLARERARALRKYNMLVLAGLEFNKDGYTKNSSAHLLAIDLRYAIDPTLELPELIAAIQEQGGLAVASHPHIMQSEWGKNTLYLWNHQEQFAPLLDAWEIANRENLFNPIGLKRLPYIANSDFHKPKHIYSWKTLLYCAKNPQAIKQCIRANRDVAITLFRDTEKRQADCPRRSSKPDYDLPPMAVPAALN